MTTKEPIYLDNAHNKEHNPIISFEEYRDLHDPHDGLMRRGIFNPDLYFDVVTDESTVFATYDGRQLPIVVANAITHEFETAKVGETALLTSEVLVLLKPEIADTLLIQRQRVLPDEFVQRILTEPEMIDSNAFTAALDVPEEDELVCGTGLPEYMVFSAYDTSKNVEMRTVPCPEIYSRDGHLITSDKTKLLARLPELIELHTDTFEKHTASMGYYGGLDPETIEELINNPDFIPIAAFDKDTGEPLMFALFSPNFTDLESIDWLNPSKARAMIDAFSKDGKKTTLNLPLVVTSKLEGLGLFGSACEIAAHETAYRTNADTTFLMYESNAFSIFLTPKTINKTLKRLGIENKGTYVEATYLAQKRSITTIE